MASGLVILMSDVCSKWIEILKESHIDILGLHANPSETSIEQYLKWFESKYTQQFIDKLERNGIVVQHYLHAIKWLLPRNLFDKSPNLFRYVDGKRQADANLCVSSNALEIVSHNSYKLAKILHQNSHSYHIWADDGEHNFCYCDKCKDIPACDQVMMITNAIFSGIKAYDTDAKLSYLCYADAENIPKIKPRKGVFLEFAPFYRQFDKPLGEGEKNTFYKNLLQNLLKVFTPYDTEILEYFLDVSLFSKWNRDNIQPLDFNELVWEKDINFYSSLGIKCIKSFAAYMDEQYLTHYSTHPIRLFGDLVRKNE